MSKQMNWTERNGRTYLKDVLPLDTPFSVSVEPARICNFMCIYCIHATEEGSNNNFQLMPLDLFNKFIQDMKLFPKKIKTLHFSGYGEPLLNKNMPEFVKLAKEIANETVIITNGALLTPEKSDALIDAGVNIIRISLQGSNVEEYYKTAGIKIDFEKFISNIKYLYENRKQCKVILRAPDICIDTEDKYKDFYNVYGNICDGIYIQNICPIQINVNCEKIKKDYKETVYKNQLVQEVNVCSLPFYSMFLIADGSVKPCCSLTKEIIGNINSENMYEIWNGKKMRNIRLLHLKNERNKIPSCKICNAPKYFDNEYDNIDSVANQFIDKF